MGCGHDFLGNLDGFLGGEIHWQFHTATFDEQPYHARIGWPDLQVSLDIAFRIDSHGLLRR